MRFRVVPFTLPLALLFTACSSTSVNPTAGGGAGGSSGGGGAAGATCGAATGGASGGSGVCAYGEAECDSSAGPCETGVECVLCPWGDSSCDNVFTRCARDNACACDFQCQIQCVRNELGSLNFDKTTIDGCDEGCGSSLAAKAAMVFVTQNAPACCSLH
jgi:hypothetical protein